MAIFHHYEGHLLRPSANTGLIQTVLPAGLDDEENFIYLACSIEDSEGAISYVTMDIKVEWKYGSDRQNID